MVARVPIHIYHPGGEKIRDEVRRAVEPERAVELWTDPAEFAAGIAQAEVLFAICPPRGHFAGAGRLRLIQILSAGPDVVLPAPDLPDRVQLAGLGGEFAAHTSEYVLAMMLAHCRSLPTILSRQRAKDWRAFPCDTLSGKTVGILGLGQVGRRVARLADAFGMHVLGLRNRSDKPAHVAELFNVARLGELLSRSDYVVVALPRTDQTHRLLGAEALRHLRAEATLINVSRGGIVDEEVLDEMLRAGDLGAAALDVFEQEPLADDSPLWDAPNTIISPHLAGHARGYLAKAVEVLVANIGRLERGEKLLHRIDRERGYLASD